MDEISQTASVNISGPGKENLLRAGPVLIVHPVFCIDVSIHVIVNENIMSLEFHSTFVYNGMNASSANEFRGRIISYDS